MTLVVSLVGRKSIWLLTDRRLSANGKPWRDNAVKFAEVGATDGTSLVGYAGLGATPRGLEPSRWIVNVLRGRGALTTEESLEKVAELARAKLPRYLFQMGMQTSASSHSFLIPSIVNGETRHYSIETSFHGTHFEQHLCRWTHEDDPQLPATPIGLAGTGGEVLQRVAGLWARPLLSTLKRFETGRSSEHRVANYLGGLAKYAYENTGDGTVGPRSTVVWRHLRGGGSHKCWAMGVTEDQDFDLPIVSQGTDMGTMAARIGKAMLAHQRGDGPYISTDLISELLEGLPTSSDDRLI